MPLVIVIYNIIYLTILLVFLPFLIIAALFSAKYRDGFFNRFGFIPRAFIAKVEGRANIWLHAASAGEVKCILPLAAALKEKYPKANIVFTTTGINGQRILKKVAQDIPACYLPFDINILMKPLVRLIKPKLLVAAETEYWPGLFYLVKKEGAKIALVNGRFSRKGEKRYSVLRLLTRKVFSFVDVFAMRSGEDAAFVKKIGVRADRVTVTGDLKSEKPLPEPDKKDTLKKILLPMLKEKVVVFGSIHYKEAGDIFGAFRMLKEKTPEVTAILAPRFLEQTTDFAKLAEAEGLKYALRSKPASTQVDLVILDSMGELAYAYELCTLAFVGGSLVAGIGGHNLLEPVYLGKPVFYGPYAFNFKEMAEEVSMNLVGFPVKDAEALAAGMLGIINDQMMLLEIKKNCEVLLEKLKGSTVITLELLVGLLPDAAL